MYKTLTEIAKNYSVSTSFIKKNYSLIEGEHFIFIGKMKRFDTEKMHDLLVSAQVKKEKNHSVMERLLLKS